VGAPSRSKGIFSYLSGLTGSRPLERADIDPVLAQFRELLVEKNVAVDIATKLCDSVAASLEARARPPPVCGEGASLH
jgi:signal recognition particle receptor subunit alpha